ncbi:hypothetical protein ckin74_04440 [Helicobacter pylori]
MGGLIEKWFGFSPIREELEARIGELEDENAELLREKAVLIDENTEWLRKNENLAVNISGLENSNDQL